MGIIKAVNLIFDYIRHDEEEDKDEVSHALKGVSLDIKEGEFVAILGHNGSGKSTFAKLMNGILLPTDGTVYISKMRTDDEEHLWDVRKTAGMVFQNPDNQIVTDKVWHELSFGLESLGYDNATIRLRVAEMASYFGIHQWFYKNVSELSGGQKQLLNLAAIMAMHPKLLILDEPMNGLDNQGVQEMRQLFLKLKDEGKTILLASHNREDIAALCDTTVEIDRGKIVG